MKLPIILQLVAIALLGTALAGCGGEPKPAKIKCETGIRRLTTRELAQSRPASAPSLQRFEYAQIHMGVRTRLVVYATDETAAVNACRSAFARVAQVDAVASDYRVDSELNRLCVSAVEKPVKLSDDLYTLLSEGQRISELSGGAFDVTVGPYVRLWRKARKAKELPKPEELAAARELVGYQKLHVDATERTARLDKAGMQLDLGGIAKGYAGDCAIAVLKEEGIGSALFEAGGDIVVSGAPPDHPEGWTIELVDPGPETPATVAIHDAAISTSGDTVQFVEIEGKHYSHVVDPRTGIGLTSRAMATVVAPKGLWADPLSKPATMLDAGGLGKLLREYPGVRAYPRVLK